MKNFKFYSLSIAIIAMLFTSCSKEDSLIDDVGGEKATLSLGAVLNDLVTNRAQLKQAIADIPECSDAAPAYVEVVLTGAQNVGTNEDPVVVQVHPSPIQEDGQDVWFTQESADLELTPGSYQLQHFAVFSGGDDLIWLAPKAGSDMAHFVDNPLPIDINLGAGVKKYVDVEVLCFDDRDVNLYGYLFFDIIGVKAIEFCIFGNYCPPSGRHYPAEFSVDVWVWNDGQRGDQLYDGVTNTVELNDDGDYAGSVACFQLPDRSGLDEYYFEITLLDSDAYGDVQNRIIRRGVITDDVVRSFFGEGKTLDYYHFREGCGEDGPPIFEDPDDEATHYKACLYPTDDSYATGFAFLRLMGNTLDVTVMATNLEANKSHMQHIHQNAECDDAGGILWPLDDGDGTYPVANAMGQVIYTQSFDVTGETLNLDDRTINLHGKTIGGSYNAGYVVSCGAIDEIVLD
ncbi:hypothetical protein ACW6QP_05525 [Salegentibacter sp. HM20]